MYFTLKCQETTSLNYGRLSPRQEPSTCTCYHYVRHEESLDNLEETACSKTFNTTIESVVLRAKTMETSSDLFPAFYC
jgi:hypothetical protein